MSKHDQKLLKVAFTALVLATAWVLIWLILLMGTSASVSGQEPLHAPQPDPVAPRFAKLVTVRKVHDADTITDCTIHLGWGLNYTPPQGMRAAGFDAWEVNEVRRTVNVTEVEKVRGKWATEDFLKLLNSGGQLYVEDSGEPGAWDRQSGYWWYLTLKGDWIYIPKWMEERGHLREPRK